MADEKQNDPSVGKTMKDFGAQFSEPVLRTTQRAVVDLVTIQFASKDSRDGTDLKRYLEQALDVRMQEEFVESENWPLITLFVAPAAVAVARYAGKALTDALIDLLRTWLQQKRHITEINLYGPDGKIIKKISVK